MKPAVVLACLAVSGSILVANGQVFSTALAATYIAGAIALKIAAKIGFAAGIGLGNRHQSGGGEYEDSYSSSSYSSAPASSYGAPAASYGAPAASYGAPAASYGAPTASYGAPAASYGAPAASYGAPAASYAAPSSGYGRTKRLAVDPQAIILEASQEDSYDCAKKLVCLIHAKPVHSLSFEEQSIYNLFGHKVETLDVSRDTVEFEVAALMGRKVGVAQCQKIYARCPHEQATLMEAIKGSFYQDRS